MRAYDNELRMVRKYASNGRFKLLATIHLKTLAVKILNIFGLMAWLLKRRGNSVIEKNVLDNYWKVIKTIKETYVEGLK
jgi:hypothetical protein